MDHSDVGQKAEVLAREAVSQLVTPGLTLRMYLKLKVSEGYNVAKEAWNTNSGPLRSRTPAPKLSCADRARNSIARVIA